MAEIPIQFPFSGVSDDLAHEKQRQGTTRHALNVRGIDRRTGRTRGAQRAGTVRFVNAQVSGSNAVKRMGKVTYAQATVDYSLVANGSGAGGVESSINPLWQVRTPTRSTSTPAVVQDSLSNVYAADGRARVAKYNIDGELVCSVSIPLEDEYLLVRALAVSADGGYLWVGVSGISVTLEYSGGRQKRARTYCFKAQPDDEGYELLWELKPPTVLQGHADDTGRGAFTEEIHLRAGRLWTAQNEPDLNRAFVRVYEFPTSETPELVFEAAAPFPIHGFDVGQDNDYFVAAAENALRGIDPRAVETTAQTVDWTPEDLPFWERRGWAWVRGDNVDGLNNASLADGDEVTRWVDTLGNGRDLVVWNGDSLGTTEGPRFRSVGSTAHPCVEFDQSGSAAQAMQGLAQTSTLASSADLQRTFLPGYAGHMYAMFIVCRVPSQTPRTFLCGYNRTGDTAAQAIVMNASTGAAAADPTTADLAGYVSRVDRLVSGGLAAAGPSDFMIEGQYDTMNGVSTGDFAIIAVTCANAQNADGLSPQQSVFWVNGQAIDRVVDDAAQTSDGIFWLGREFDSGGGYPATGGGALTGEIMEILVLRDYIDDAGTKRLIQLPNYPDGAWAGINDETEFQRVIGHFAHKYGLAHNTPTGAASATNFPFPFHIAQTATTKGGPPRLSGISTTSVRALMNDVSPLLAKFDSSGDPKWCVVGEPSPATANTGVGGVGWGVRVSEREPEHVFSFGPRNIATSAAPTTAQELRMNAVVRKIHDEGDAFDLNDGGVNPGSWEDAWGASGSREDPLYEWPRMAVGTGQEEERDLDTLSVPVAAAGIVDAVYIYLQASSTLETTPSITIELPDQQQGYAVARDPNPPIYLPKNLSINLPERLVIGAAATGSPADDETLLVYRLVLKAQNTNQPRLQRIVAVSNGAVTVRNSAGTSWVAPAGSLTLDTAARWVDFVEAFGKGYLTDGSNDLVYTPDDGTTNGTLARWRSESSGRMPEGFLLLALFNGRLVRGRSLSDPQNWCMSMQGDPNNWDFLPPVFDPRQAIFGNGPYAGNCPDAITALCPVRNDLLVFGCDHSIYVMRGDPAIGGKFDLVSDVTGMAFGRAWTKDPNGALWFFGSRGGLYYWNGVGDPQRVTLRTIEERLRNVDLVENYVELEWNWRHEGLHVFVIPKDGSAASVVTQYFFDVKNGFQAPSPWPDTFPTGKQVTCSALIDGDDPDDRVLLIGCEDGRVRTFSDTALSDDDGNDNDPIKSEVLIGPLALPDSSYEWVASRPTINLAGDQNGARAQFYVSDTPDLALSVPLEVRTLYPGRNPRLPMRISGPLLWIALANYQAREGWAFEGGCVEVRRGRRVHA